MGLKIYWKTLKRLLYRIVPSSSEKINHPEATFPNRNALLSRP